MKTETKSETKTTLKDIRENIVKLLKPFGKGLSLIVEVLIPIIAIILAVCIFWIIPQYTGYYACLLFIMGTIVGIYVVIDTMHLGNTYRKIDKEPREKKKTIKKEDGE